MSPLLRSMAPADVGFLAVAFDLLLAGDGDVSAKCGAEIEGRTGGPKHVRQFGVKISLRPCHTLLTIGIVALAASSPKLHSPRAGQSLRLISNQNQAHA